MRKTFISNPISDKCRRTFPVLLLLRCIVCIVYFKVSNPRRNPSRSPSLLHDMSKTSGRSVGGNLSKNAVRARGLSEVIRTLLDNDAAVAATLTIECVLPVPAKKKRVKGR